ncbi:MAG: hypothetical protein HFJ80_02325 [Clostridiales bacterium]|nr:hypothetical protein [Clostridiales bacterium]
MITEKTALLSRVQAVLEENGIFITDAEAGDQDLSDYFEDSIQFMSTILALEETFGILFPPDAVNMDFFSSLENLCETIAALQEEGNQTPA